MIGVHVPPSVPVPHPAAPDAFPAVRLPKHLCHPDFHPVLAAAVELDVARRRARLAGRLPAVRHRRAGRHLHPVAHLRSPEPDADGARRRACSRASSTASRRCAWASSRPAAAGCPIWCTPSTSTGRSASATSTPHAHAAMAGSRASCCASAVGADGEAPSPAQGPPGATISTVAPSASRAPPTPTPTSIEHRAAGPRSGRLLPPRPDLRELRVRRPGAGLPARGARRRSARTSPASAPTTATGTACSRTA